MEHLNSMTSKETVTLNPMFSMLNKFARECKRLLLYWHRLKRPVKWDDPKAAEVHLFEMSLLWTNLVDYTRKGELHRMAGECVNLAVRAACLWWIIKSNDAHLHTPLRADYSTKDALQVVKPQEEETFMARCGECGALRSTQTTYCPTCGGGKL